MLTDKYYIFFGIMLLIMLTICVTLVLYSIIACYVYLRKHKNTLSPKTAHLYKTLLNVLIIDVVFASCTGMWLF
jgi:amino acid permease